MSEHPCEQSTEEPRPLTAKVFYRALVNAGIIQEGVSRVIIDLNRGDLIMHIEQYPDTRLLSLIRTLDGIQISRVDDAIRGAYRRLQEKIDHGADQP